MDEDKRLDDNTTIDHTFVVVLGDASRTEPLRSRSALYISQPLAVHWLLVPSVAWWTGRARVAYAPLAAEFPASVNLLALRWRDGNNGTCRGGGAEKEGNVVNI